MKYTAFASRKGKAITARLIVRRVRDLNLKAAGQGELFPAWRSRDLVGAGQAARAGGPHPAWNRLVHSAWRCQPAGRYKVMWPRPWRAMRAATSIRSRRIVAPRALACRAEARTPAARVRLCAIAARTSQAALAAKIPEGASGQRPAGEVGEGLLDHGVVRGAAPRPAAW